MTSTPTPHDSLFKSTFSQVEHAAGLLRHILPPELARRVDFATLALDPGSFVDEELNQRHTDLLFTAQLSGRPAYFYFLAEHQSTVDDLMGLRLLRYELRIWDGWLEENPAAKRVPPIIPLVLHHSAAGWTASVAFEAILDVDAEVLEVIRPYVPSFRFLLDDVSEVSDEALRERAMSALGRLVLWCLRISRTPEDFVRGIEGWSELVREVERASNGAAALNRIFRYIFAVNARSDAKEFAGLLTQAVEQAVGEEGKAVMASLADYFREEGERKGRDEGERKGRVDGLLEGERNLLLRLLRVRFGEPPEAAIERVKSAEMTQLEVWAERVLSAPTLDDVLGDA